MIECAVSNKFCHLKFFGDFAIVNKTPRRAIKIDRSFFVSFQQYNLKNVYIIIITSVASNLSVHLSGAWRPPFSCRSHIVSSKYPVRVGPGDTALIPTRILPMGLMCWGCEIECDNVGCLIDSVMRMLVPRWHCNNMLLCSLYAAYSIRMSVINNNV